MDDRTGDLGVSALDEKVEEREDALLPMLTSTGSRPRDSGNNGNRVKIASATRTSTKYKGSYLLCRRPLICVLADIQRVERYGEQQLREKHILDRWPRVLGAGKLRPLYQGISTGTERWNSSTSNSLAVFSWVRGSKMVKGVQKALEE